MPRREAGGFTLVEVLVVVVVIGIASGIVIASLGGDERRSAEREARRLAGALEHAAALAQWKSEMLGVSADGAAYRFWRRTRYRRHSRSGSRPTPGPPLPKMRYFRFAPAGATSLTRSNSPPPHGPRSSPATR